MQEKCNQVRVICTHVGECNVKVRNWFDRLLGLSPLSPALCRILTVPGGAENQMCPAPAHLSLSLILEAPFNLLFTSYCFR